MSDYEKDLENTRELFDFLQGTVPDGHVIEPSHIPHLTPDQAATVIWYLGNKYWQVTDHVERCDVCGEWYNQWSEGATVDCAPPPIFFCGNCCDGEEAQRKRRIERGLEKAQRRCRLSNDQAEASGARGRPIANPDAPAALPPAHGWADATENVK